MEDIIKQMIATAKVAIPTMAYTHEVNAPGAPSTAVAATTQVVTLIMAQTHEVTTPGAPSMNPAAPLTDHDDERKDYNDHIRPLLQKDMKAPPEFNGSKKDFLMWRESFASMLTCKTTKWEVIMKWVRKRKEKRIINGMAKSEFDKSPQYDKYISDNFEIFQKHFYRYVMDFTKDKARTDVMAGKEQCVYESYRQIMRKGLQTSEERRLDVEAEVLNPRCAKNEKDVFTAIEERRQDQALLWKRATRTPTSC